LAARGASGETFTSVAANERANEIIKADQSPKHWSLDKRKSKEMMDAIGWTSYKKLVSYARASQYCVSAAFPRVDYLVPIGTFSTVICR
jgi:hypothetical protein